MRISYLCLILVLFSPICMGAVELSGSGTIHDALLADQNRGDKAPVLTLEKDQVEVESSDLTFFTSVTLDGSAGKETVIQPAPSKLPFGLFNSKDSTMLTLSQVTIEGFMNDYGGAMSAADVTLSGPATFKGNTATIQGGAITSNGFVTLFGPVSFTGNRAARMGAIAAVGSVTLSGPATFTANTATRDMAGAIGANDYVTLSGQATFRGNTAPHNYGGAIFNGGDLSLTDAQFEGNRALQGGAVFTFGNFTYTITPGTTITLNPTTSPPALGDNDIASGFSLRRFAKVGEGTLVLNTNNSAWIAHTTVTEGSLIIGGGAANASAVWGNPGTDVRGSIIVGGSKQNAKLGGFGTIYADGLFFQPRSVWCLFFEGTRAGRLDVGGMLFLPALVTIGSRKSLLFDFPTGGYTVATYGKLAGDLGILNTQLGRFDLFLEEHRDSSTNSLILMKRPSKGTHDPKRKSFWRMCFPCCGF